LISAHLDFGARRGTTPPPPSFTSISAPGGGPTPPLPSFTSTSGLSLLHPRSPRFWHQEECTVSTVLGRWNI
jgi:hypothetical protein